LRNVGFDALPGIVLLGGLLGVAANAVSAPQERIRGSIDSHNRVILQGGIHPKVHLAVDRGVVEPWMEVNYMRLVLKPSAQQAAQLEQFLEQQRDPSSPYYRHWLTPEEFGDWFGVNQNDLGKITSWLQTEGFTIERVARARNWIAFSGTAAQVSAAFRTGMHRYSADGETHFANIAAPSIPAALADVVETVRGLDDFRPTPPRLKRFHPDYNSSSGAHYLAPDDLAAIYDIAPLYQAGYDGTGQTLVIPGQTDISLSDIRTFRAKFGLAARDPQLVLYGKDPGISSGDQVEASLDLEWSGAVARNATIVYVYSQDVFESLQYAIDQNLGTVISVSYGGCETGNPSSFRAVAQQANAQGITWMNAAGDSGAAGCDSDSVASATHGPAVTFPANIPEVTGVGGTEFSETGTAVWGTNGANLGSATSYIPEKVWNDTPIDLTLAASGGGASTVFAKPWWQAGPGVPNDSARDVPDVALAASADHDGYLMYAQGGYSVVGGTSASSPSFAGIVTLLNQYVVAKGIQAKPGLGNINPNLYSLAQTTAGVFHDITAGNNIVPCKPGTTGCATGSFGYSAGPGYDLASGLGSVDAYLLVTKWAGAPAGAGTTMTLTASSTSISLGGTTQLTAKVTAVSGTTAPTGTVAFTNGSQSLGSAILTPAGTGAAATASLTVTGASLQAGSNTVTATYSSNGNFASSSASVAIAVTGSALSTTTSVTANPSILPSTAATQLLATVKPASGSAAPTGSVTFSTGSTTLGTATLSVSGATSTATLAVNASRLAIGGNSITASYIATGSFTNSSGTVSVTVTAAPVATTTSASANPSTVASGGSTRVTATVKPASGTTAPTGNVTFSLGFMPLGTEPLTASGATSTATFTVEGSSLASGTNNITVSYVASGNFSNSSGSATVLVTAPTVVTTTSLAAYPSTIASAASTQLIATVLAANRASLPTGTVTFSLGGVALGSAPVSLSGAILTVKGSSLTIGNNTITASYKASGNFANSSGSTTVTVTAPAVATTTSVAANPSTIAAAGSTALTATVKAASGTVAPAGTIAFKLGNTTLGSATLSGSGGTARATLTVYGSSLAANGNNIKVTYSGAPGFTGSTGSTTVFVTPAAGSARPSRRH